MHTVTNIHTFAARTGAALLGLATLLSYGLAHADTTATLLPASVGTYNTWTPSTGSTHYTLVDESSCNGTTDYVYTTTAAQRDSYGVSLASIPNGSTITAIAITPCASKNKSSSNSTMQVFYRYNGSNSADAGAYALSGTTPTVLATTSFSSLSLVKGSASTLEIGAVLSSAGGGGRLSRIATVLTYTTLAAPTSLSATPVSQTRIDLGWTDTSSNETGFRVERSSVSSSGPFTAIATTSQNATSYSDTGVSAATTYWYRVTAVNSGGESGASNVASATTPANVPSVTTNNATDVTNGTATLQGSANPNGSSATGWFRYSTSNPGTCNDSFGTRSPASGGTALGAGSSPVGYTSGISGLAANTTYYYCAIASNSGGTGVGSVTVFTTLPNVPTVTTNSATSITKTTATLQGAANPNGSSATGWFRYSTTNPGACDDSFGTRSPSSGGTSLGASSSPVSYSSGVSGLIAGTTYYYCAIASNSGGTGLGSIVSFTTTPNAPTAPDTLAVTNVSSSENDLTWNDNSSNESGFTIERSTTGQYGPFAGIATTSADVTSYQDTGRSADTTYWYRVRAYNAGGYSSYTNVSYGITATVVPNDPANLSVFGSTSTMYLSWTHTGSNEDGFRVERGTDGVNFTEIGTTGINTTYYTDNGVPSGTYYWRVRAYNAIGTSSYSNVASGTVL